MKPIVTDWTIVVVGSWNVAILNPDWFARNITETRQIEVQLILDNLTPRFRFLHQSLVVIPQTDRVIFGVREPTDEALLLDERAADKLLAALPVTPISAIGVNFGVTIDEPSNYLATVFRLADLPRFAERDVSIEETRITRRIPYDERTYNFTMALGTDGQVRFKAITISK